MRGTIVNFILIFFMGLVCTSTLMFFSSSDSYQANELINVHPALGV